MYSDSAGKSLPKQSLADPGSRKAERGHLLGGVALFGIVRVHVDRAGASKAIHGTGIRGRRVAFAPIQARPCDPARVHPPFENREGWAGPRFNLVSVLPSAPALFLPFTHREGC